MKKFALISLWALGLKSFYSSVNVVRNEQFKQNWKVWESNLALSNRPSSTSLLEIIELYFDMLHTAFCLICILLYGIRLFSQYHRYPQFHLCPGNPEYFTAWCWWNIETFLDLSSTIWGLRRINPSKTRKRIKNKIIR